MAERETAREKMSSARLKPVALTIAGSDSGGGAGIQADLQTFAALGVHGASAITCITAQNPGAITRLEACAAKMVRAQIEAVFSYAPPAAAKTGLLYSAAIVREVARFFRRTRGVPLVVDPVMMATSGRRLLQRDALATLRRELLPLAALVTPNLAEAEALIGKSIRTPEELRAAARTICQTVRLRGSGQRGPPGGRGQGGGFSVRRGGRMDGVDAAGEGRGPARRRMQVFGGHHRVAGAGRIAAGSRGVGQDLHRQCDGRRCKEMGRSGMKTEGRRRTLTRSLPRAEKRIECGRNQRVWFNGRMRASQA